MLLDISNPLDGSQGFPPTLFVKDTDSLAEQLQRAFPAARVVKSLNTMTAAVMVDPGRVSGGEHSVFVSGDDEEAKQTVASLLEDFGHTDVIDLGDLSTARGAEMYLPLWLRLMGHWARRSSTSRSCAERGGASVPLVTVLATGGTIASRSGAGGATAQDGGDDLVGRLDLPPGLHVRVRDVVRVGGFRMTLDRVHEVALAVAAELRDDAAAGVVISHGTDTIEETAFFLDLFHDDPRPVVVTGAQRAADAADTDGPRNLSDAVVAAAAPAARGLGVLIGFGGQLFPARGTRKTHTVAADTFANPAGGPLGWVRGGTSRS